MPMKQLLHRLQPIQVYIVLILSVLYFSVQMFVSQKSQSITLLVHAYHMLCNIIALSGCIITIKVRLFRDYRLLHDFRPLWFVTARWRWENKRQHKLNDLKITELCSSQRPLLKQKSREKSSSLSLNDKSRRNSHSRVRATFANRHKTFTREYSHLVFIRDITEKQTKARI
jgi:hypothetical protein